MVLLDDTRCAIQLTSIPQTAMTKTYELVSSSQPKPKQAAGRGSISKSAPHQESR